MVKVYHVCNVLILLEVKFVSVFLKGSFTTSLMDTHRRTHRNINFGECLFLNFTTENMRMI